MWGGCKSGAQESAIVWYSGWGLQGLLSDGGDVTCRWIESCYLGVDHIELVLEKIDKIIVYVEAKGCATDGEYVFYVAKTFQACVKSY